MGMSGATGRGMQTNAADLSVSETILRQLGGARFAAMTGARDFMGCPNALQFKLPRGAKGGINAVRVVLDAGDTYTVTFYKVWTTVRTVSESSGLHFDQLRAVFTAATGLHTSL